MSEYVELSEDQFLEQFPLLPNHLNPNASFDWGDGFGTLFEIYGEEWNFVFSQPVENVWTLAESDGQLYIFSGRGFVNRLGYFVSRIPCPESAFIEVFLD